jgi:hypothetical protein
MKKKSLVDDHLLKATDYDLAQTWRRYQEERNDLELLALLRSVSMLDECVPQREDSRPCHCRFLQESRPQ